MRRLRLRGAGVLGWSMGGTIAQSPARRYLGESAVSCSRRQWPGHGKGQFGPASDWLLGYEPSGRRSAD